MRAPAAVAVALAAVLAVLAVSAVGATPAQAATARWIVSDERAVPLEWFQGLTHSAAGSRFFVGIAVGVTRTDRRLDHRVRNGAVIPGPVQAATGFNHVGDPTWDRAEGGRLILPLECFTAGAPDGGNTCRRGAFGVADPATLLWRYLVPLDPADIAKAMWAEVSPDGALLWTSSGNDLLAYRTADVSAAAAAAAVPIRPVRRLAGAVPPSGITGAAFRGRRLLLAGAAGLGPLQVWSVDVDGTGARRLEAQLPVAAESEGLDLLADGDGLLHWLLSPFAPGGRPATFGTGHSEMVSLVPRAGARLRVRATRVARTALRADVALRVGGRWRPVRAATVTTGARKVTTATNGRALLRGVGAGRLSVTARKLRLPAGRTVVAASRR